MKARYDNIYYNPKEPSTIADAIRVLRIRHMRMSQARFAARLGTSQGAVARLESNNYDGYTVKTLERTAEATGTRLFIHFDTDEQVRKRGYLGHIVYKRPFKNCRQYRTNIKTGPV
jgi:transcriptional regulator with XRE-family HTH domain